MAKQPGEDPLSQLLKGAGKEIERRLKEWAEQNGVSTSQSSSEQEKAKAKFNSNLRKKAQAKAQATRNTPNPELAEFGHNHPPSSGVPPVYQGGDEPPSPPLKVGKIIRWVVTAWFFVYLFNKIVPHLVQQGFGDRDSADFNVLNGFNWEIVMGNIFGSTMWLVLFIVCVIFVVKSIRVVPQQRAIVLERLGRFHAVLEPGLRFTIPFVDRVSARHDLREVALDVPSQICITKDNTQLQVDGILYFQVTDPKLATYGSSNFIVAITQLAQTTLRSVIGKLELDKTFEERDMINHAVVSVLDEAAMNWGVKVLRYEIKDLTPPKEILLAMQAQITAEREKRALIAASEGRKQEQINIAMGQKEAAIAKSEGDKISEINQAQGEAAATLAKAEANAEAIRKIAQAIESQGGLQAVNLKVAEQYVAAFSQIAQKGNTVVVPQNLTDIAGLVTAATSVIKAQR